MEHRTENPKTRRSALVVGLLLIAASCLQAQPLPPQIPPGHVLVGDMILPSASVWGDSVYSGMTWDGGVVPYKFHSNVSPENRILAGHAMAEVEAISGIDFVPHSTEWSHIQFVDSTGNSSMIGKQLTFGQDINIASWGSHYIIVHEIFHALSFKHEQCRPDRDTYVTINWANIQSGESHNFDLDSGATSVGPYDFLSIMHYGECAFSVSCPTTGSGCGCPTITCKPEFASFQSQMGNLSYMTSLDAQGVQDLYGAPAPPKITALSPPSVTAASGGFTLTVTGAGFFRGSPNSNGVQGTRVLWNNIPLDTTYISPIAVEATVPSFILNAAAGGSCVVVRVENQLPGGGQSAPAFFTVNSATPTPGAWVGGTPGSRMGEAVAVIGDVDGDGCDDIVLGEPGFAGSTPDGGRVRCVSGRTGAMIWARFGTGSSSPPLAPIGDRLGASVANAGDVDEDGIDDVLIGSPGSLFNTGAVLCVRGADGITIHTLQGEDPGDRFGEAVANAGDVNEDGAADHVVGAPSRNSSGWIGVFSGGDSSLIWSYDGTSAEESLGARVCGGYDLDGDEIPDVVASSPTYRAAGRHNEGAFTVFSGGDGTPFFSAVGGAEGALMGFSVALMPSVDGIAGTTLVVGTPEFGGALPGIGRAYLYGTAGGSTLSLITTLLGDGAVSDRFGSAVAYAGDIDQDGFPDIAVGAERSTLGSGPLLGSYVRVFSGKNHSLLLHQSEQWASSGFGAAIAGNGDTNGDGCKDLVVGAPLGCAETGRVDVIAPVFPPEPRKIMITEVSWGVGGVEVTNFGPIPVNLAGWRLLWKDGTVLESAPLDTVIQEGEIIVVKESGGSFAETPATTQVLERWGGLPTSSEDLTVALVTPSGVVLDEVRISDTAGSHTEGSLGGGFRGLATRGTVSTASLGCCERIWGLDSNAGADWTEQRGTSMGLENRSSGPRGTDPIPVPLVRINEIDGAADYVELVNRQSALVDLHRWTLLALGDQGTTHQVIRPFPYRTELSLHEYVVIGNAAASPSELPSSTGYVNLSLLGTSFLPFSSEELECALYDAYGRLVDLVRTTGHDDNVRINHPRAPSAWDAFTGAAGRSAMGAACIGRFGSDSDTGADWYPTIERSMGSANSNWAISGSIGTAHGLDVRLHDGGTDGVTMIINAGSSRAGYRWSFLFSAGHLQGQGPFFGLGASAIANYTALSTTPPWFGFLDSEGSARLDIPIIGPGFKSDDIFILQSPGGDVAAVSEIIEFDT